jgi:hypothetical protein
MQLVFLLISGDVRSCLGEILLLSYIIAFELIENLLKSNEFVSKMFSLDLELDVDLL